ncbi:MULTISPECIES: SulP family inorganic anion transporter [Acidithiobacillus]|jgi:Sulfate permease and related transporters (MFS superfamily)|uniref:SulP family inorganic anion transporter n=1 Tax=Acidithiobacillus ferridurans TaxID=1232575 RepID=A0A8X8G5N2_ACIFI|nr:MULTISPECIES: SulP family inorganic anion transporter [Acidithiobacillus]MBU2715275.1 SulP family inorganic anion transporter [Acidithiobacillus ferridurans]MBU2722675.1 SulP family inorganic anion transporter [Acidithiobacillus ferridurans]MBU2727280.1 SulP family inorganic anion transporter [Acidithiobacillus ferridurans]MDA8247349.1 SulP family inorganic anion transporter [Acidithiobacillus sp.]
MSETYTFSDVKTNVLSGLLIALALVPEAIAFSFVAHVPLISGLYGAFFMVLITSVFGGRPGMVSAFSGATAVVMTALMLKYGIDYVFAAVVLMGIIQILFSLAKLSKYVRIIPRQVNLGFINGLAVVIFLAQMDHFKVPSPSGAEQWMHGSQLYIMLGLVALTMVVIYLLPLLTKAIPATLAGALVTTFAVIFFHVPTTTVGNIAHLAGNFPTFRIPDVPFSWSTLYIVAPYSFILAANALIETLLTLNLIDEMTDTRGKPNKESMAQGIGNLVSGFFGATGGCALLGESIINVTNNALKRLSGVTTAIALMAIILFASHWIEQVPIAALVGVMFVVVEKTFEWSSLRFFGKLPAADVAIGILVGAMTIFVNITLAVVTGVILSALLFAWEHAKHMTIKTYDDDQGRRVYEVEGTLFFASAHEFSELFSPRNDPERVIIDFKKARIVDHSAIEAIDSLAERYRRRGKSLQLQHLSRDCLDLLHAAKDICVFEIDDPRYYIADDKIS